MMAIIIKGKGFDDESSSPASPHLLLVEGKDDAIFFRSMMEYMGLDGIEIWNIEGKTQFRTRLRVLKMDFAFNSIVTSLGIVRDADDDPESALMSVKDALRAAGFDVPDRSFISAGSRPIVTFAILPDDSPGMLESVCLKSIESDPAMSCVDRYFECLKTICQIEPRNIYKAKVQAFLASREKVGLDLRQAAQAGYWKFDHDVFAPVRCFLTKIAES
jgi:hypothetical protein